MDLTRTFGRLRYGRMTAKQTDYRPRYAWQVVAEPHVIIRAKRLFPRASPTAHGSLELVDTPEVCNDLQWLMMRWPLDMTEADRARLAEQVERFEQTMRTITEIQQGSLRLGGDDWLVPAVEPYWYQSAAADLVLATGQGNAVHGIGLGKTFTGLLVLRPPDARPGLVVTLGGAMPNQWVRQCNKFFPQLSAVVGPAGQLSRRRQALINAADVIVIPYSRLTKYEPTLRGVARTVIFDEDQELRHFGTGKYVAAQSLRNAANYVMGGTATPVYNFAGEIWDITEVLAPGALGSKTEFTREWAGVHNGATGAVSIADSGPLGAHLRELGLMDVKSRQDVGLPPEELEVLPWEIDVEAQLDVIHEATADLATLAKRVLARDGSTQERLDWNREIDFRMRRATGLAKAPGVIDLVQMLAAANEKVLLFAWHRDVYDVYLEGLAGLNPVMYTGTESPQQKERALSLFRHRAQVCLMSLRAGAGLDGLQEFCAVAVLGELDWSPGIHTQNFGRLSRPGQTRPVLGYLTHCDYGSDPVVLDTLGVKARQEKGLRGVRLADEPTLSAGDRVRRMAEQILTGQR